jgi:hypothetical protein
MRSRSLLSVSLCGAIHVVSLVAEARLEKPGHECAVTGNPGPLGIMEMLARIRDVFRE